MQKLQLLDKTFNIQLSEKKRKSSLKWATLNLAFLSVIYYDIAATNKYSRESENFYYIEVIACAILSLSLITNVFTFIYHTFFTDKIVCENENQRILLNLSNTSAMVKSPQPKIQAPSGNQNETINIRNLSYQSYSEPNSMLSSSLHNSWMSNVSGQMKDSTFSMNPEGSFAEASNFQTPPKFKKNEFIMNRNSMDQYLLDVSNHETAVASAIEAQNNMTGFNSTNFNSFWGNCRFDEVIASLKTSLYQLSPHNSKQSSTGDEPYTSKDSENNSEIIRKICANKLSNYTANLKMWISKTILEPLVSAIDDIDKAFQQRGFTDMTIGRVGLERLKKMTQTNQHLIQHISMLPKLIPFLELTTNQEYLVQRIRELAKGSCMKSFKFNSVTNFAPDQDNIPSDAGIIFHLFCTYLDSQLHPLPDIPRAFYSRYIILGDVKKTSVENIVKEVGKNKAKCGILLSNPLTPKFNFISDKVHTSSYDRNNLFYVIIHFLMHLKSDGSLESVNLGKSGINILNVIED